MSAYTTKKTILYQSKTYYILCGLLFVLGVVGPADSYAYDVPSDRRIAWSAGLDPIGGIPSYTPVPCQGLDPTGATDNASQINACIANAPAGTASVSSAGVYQGNSNMRMKSGVVLSRAKAAVAPWLPASDSTATTLNMNGSDVIFSGGSKSSNWTPGPNNGTPITAGYTKGSTQITVSDASAYAVNNVIASYQNEDPAVIDDKNLDYLGEDSGVAGDPHVMAMYATVTAKAGTVLTIDPPIYYVTPAAVGASIRKQTFNMTRAGLENMRLRGNGTNIKFINFAFSKNCWVKGVETYNVGQNSSGSPHIWVQFSMQNEYRDGYHHHGVSNDSGRNYGIEFYNWSSQHKIENNIIRDTRHPIIFEGGGSGNVVLYNYLDDNWESKSGSGSTYDSSFLSEDAVANHGAHPYMNLWEGNVSADFWGDYTQGSSSHNTAFRNHFRCINSTLALTDPWGWQCVEIEKYNRFYNLVGNVIGTPALTTGTLLCNSSSCGGTKPFIYRFGYSSNGGSWGGSTEFNSTIKHGNFDYVTDSVAHWDGGADHTLPSSLYYGGKPAFFGTLAWPPFGPDVNFGANTIPAQNRYIGGAGAPGGGGV